MLEISPLYIGLNALIMLGLAINVSRTRLSTKTMIGDGAETGDDQMLRACRAHANNVEYVPVALLILISLELLSAQAWLLHSLGLALTLGRIFHAQGLLRDAGRSFGRVAGTSLTWLTLLAGGTASIYHAFTTVW